MKTIIIVNICLFGVLFGGGCDNKKEDLAGVKHFYFEIIDNVQNQYTHQLVQHIIEVLPQHDYLISEASANAGWPFYGHVERGSRVLKTDMMPPHTNVNRLSPLSKLKEYNQGEHSMKAVFTIENKDDKTITVIKESFEWTGSEWHKFSKKLATDFNLEDGSRNEIFIKISKTLIRYTFK
jgi:hypothetical protein